MSKVDRSKLDKSKLDRSKLDRSKLDRSKLDRSKVDNDARPPSKDSQQNKMASNDSNSKQKQKVTSFNQKFKVGKKIGAGSFGVLRLGIVIATNEKVAIKMEANNKGSTLPSEYRIYKMLGSEEGIPQVHFFGPCGKYNAMVMELLGTNLEKMFENLEKKFSLKTVIQLALQILRRVEYVHSKGVVYRDIKPENFLLGPKEGKKSNLVYIIDFGLAKPYLDRKTNKHIPYKDNRAQTGTARYMSLNTHMGREQSRRDDLEAIGYMIVYFLRGTLPWQGLPVKGSDARLKAILDCKKATEVTRLCDGLAPELVKYIDYVRQLEFNEAPRYDHLRNLFIAIFERENFTDDGLYDWNKPEYRQKSKEAISKEDAVRTYKMIEEFKQLQAYVNSGEAVPSQNSTKPKQETVKQ